MNNLVIGVDIAKRVFQLHWVEESGEIKSVQLRREKFLEHFANRAPCLVGMEACGGSQHWARELQRLGHEVRLMSARMVKPFVGGNKNDAADARAIWTAVQQPGIKGVAGRYSLRNLSALQRRVKMWRHDAVQRLMREMKDMTHTVVCVAQPLHRHAASLGG
jgi:transposase